MKISDVIERLKQLRYVAGDVEVLISCPDQDLDRYQEEFEPAGFELSMVSVYQDGFVQLEDGNDVQVVTVF